MISNTFVTRFSIFIKWWFKASIFPRFRLLGARCGQEKGMLSSRDFSCKESLCGCPITLALVKTDHPTALMLVRKACDHLSGRPVSRPWLSNNHPWSFVLIFWISCFLLSFFFVSHIHAWAYPEPVNIWIAEGEVSISIFDVDTPPGLKIVTERCVCKGQCRSSDHLNRRNTSGGWVPPQCS